ncbi:ATPase AAA [Enterobacter roggenkampii]|uniref:ATPase AAA n=1 Tax=Enterobacter roggenkampii TaxID=1812935 RepID=A0A837LAY4_9ENTR|nr:ATPase AAA [Enterobacter roggenkampii]KLP92214.1 ATPase AAA [Enterobacter roggenkampii]
MSESGKDEYLLWPGVFDEALARVMPAPSYMEWVQQVRQIACWANILRLSDAQAICERWSASGVNAAPADAGLIRAALRSQSIEKLSPFSMAGAFLRDSGLIPEIHSGRFGSYQPTAADLAKREAQRREMEEAHRVALEADERQRQIAVRQATQIYNKASLDPAQSPYWQGKCSAAALPLPLPDDVKASNWRTFEKGAPSKGIYWNHSLIVPLYRITDDLQLGMSTIEIICGRPNPETELSFTGAKRGLKGAQRGGSFYPFNIDKARHGSPLVICEGFTSGLALSLAMGRTLPVFCAMSCNNFAAVIDELRIVYNHSPIYIVGDVGVGEEIAQSIAEANTRRYPPVYSVPLSRCLFEDGNDPFDLLARHGVDNSRVLLRSLFREARIGRDGTLSAPSSSDASHNI